mgnify:FL=1
MVTRDVRQEVLPLQTTDATTTTIWSYTISDNCVVYLDVVFVAFSNGVGSAGYEATATFKRDGAGATQVGTTASLSLMEDAALALASITLDANSNYIRARVTGVAATTIDWLANVTMTLYLP